MEHIFISNGTTQLVLIPENDVDRVLLEKLLSDGPVTVDKIRNPIGVMGKSVQDGLIIRKNTLTSTE
jgi:hypothetical protein